MEKIYFELGRSHPEESLHLITAKDEIRPHNDDYRGEVQIHNHTINWLYLVGHLLSSEHHMHKEIFTKVDRSQKSNPRLSLQ